MAIKNKIGTIKDFRNAHKKKTIVLSVLSQLVVLSLLVVVLFTTGFLHNINYIFWIVLFISAATFSLVSILWSGIVNKPLNDILTALSHKANEPSADTLPNPNEKDNQASGFKSVLDTIYSVNTEPNKKEVSRHDLLTQALNHTSCGVILLDINKKIISANKAAPISKSQEGELFIALDFINDISIDDWIAEQDTDAISAEKRWRRVPTDPRVVKRQRFFDIIASYERGAEAETVVILIDQSELYLPEEEDLNFIAFAAHELRGPITVIRGYLDVFKQEMSDRFEGDEAELLSRLTISANRLSGYINNILNVAKFDRHHLKVHLREDSIADIYESIDYDMKLRAKTQHRLLNINIPKGLPTVAADRNSISEVIGNLIDNAIKYSFEGGAVTVSAEVKGDFVEVSVVDNGVGMPASVVNNLFRKFYRSHRSRETVAGTGIGLYICKAFVESHGGSIAVSSKEHHGSTFTFTLPIYATVADKLLEDDQLNQGLIRQGGGWIKNHSMYRR